jgi:hypothetical protein
MALATTMEETTETAETSEAVLTVPDRVNPSVKRTKAGKSEFAFPVLGGKTFK